MQSDGCKHQGTCGQMSSGLLRKARRTSHCNAVLSIVRGVHATLLVGTRVPLPHAAAMAAGAHPS
eukprot:2727783-Pleurochrysis_carterae.AAC.7